LDTFSANDRQAIVAEFLGTMFFVLIATGAVVAAAEAFGGDASVLTAIAIAHGIGILIAVAWTANISGGHINPAVTLAMIITRHITPILGVAYIVAQCAGAIVGSLLLKLAMPDAVDDNLGFHALADGMAAGEGLLLEIIMTAFLVLVIYNTAVSKKGWGINAPIAIGLAIMAIHFIGVPFTGASVNPARSLGPAVVAGEWSDFWIYIVGPAAGAAIVAGFWMFFRDMGREPLEDARPT
jgi:aquaporin TIP